MWSLDLMGYIFPSEPKFLFLSIPFKFLFVDLAFSQYVPVHTHFFLLFFQTRNHAFLFAGRFCSSGI